ncbi:group II intron reverse transcriptase/maturase [Staphylococcus felis]|uniref:group II intron reverse transcriptase/maturase n=1 Tax=Staphylococcus felis TaxID=46127 RepID=UPI000E25758C|nr:group II intron reverse transcriptase/maturase [Staphylococcus felis]REH75336.1 group II intron reverse transcriptase/maturase [Staphylococcus felis]REI14092.1 group II intron reverse transcriptase/maturase [Staphylococcus felis]
MYRESPTLMELVVRPSNIEKAIKRVKKNKGAPGIDGMKVSELNGHFAQYFPQIRKKLLDGTYKPQAVRKVEIPKPNGKKRVLGIPVARDRVIQQAIKQVIEPSIDRTFSNHSHGFRPNCSTGTALKECATYYEDGYSVAVDCDLKQCFDMLNHDKLMYLFERHVQDKAISKFIRRSLQVGAIDLNGSYRDREIGAPQGGVISPLLCNIYLHELDKELEKRGHRFVRYADDFVIFVRSKRAGQRVMESVTKFIEKDLKLIVNKEKSKVGAVTRLKFLSCLMTKVNGTYRFRPTMEAKENLKRALRRLTKRNRPGTFKEIITEINQVTRGWINYFGRGFIKGFITKLQPWLNRRIRQLILKRWKRIRTKYKMLRKYGLDKQSAMRVAQSRKKYWRLSKTQEVHRALTTKQLYKWGLIPLVERAELAYARY